MGGRTARDSDLPAVRMRRLDGRAARFWEELAELTAWDNSIDPQISARVDEIIQAVRARGDAALLEFTRRFDRRDVADAAALEIPRAHCEAALERIDAGARRALEHAAERLRAYAERQLLASWDFVDPHGNRLGQQVSALERVGLYVPGGKAAYPSTVLMNAIPAKVAGVAELIMVAPTPDGEGNDLVWAAAAIAGVDRVFAIGGAQAVAALAFGTETIPAVDKIVGPGNAYVAAAKRAVFGFVGIDMVAGPSEILIVADDSVPPEWLALDLFAQAEHDEDARAILVSPKVAVLERVQAEIDARLAQMPRAHIIARALNRRGALIEAVDLDQACDIANRIAPEHLELALADAERYLPRIRNAGAIFVGAYTAEVFGDYCAGPNHVLPTARTARFSSPLGVYDFQKRSSVVQCSPAGAAALVPTAATLADGEGLSAHAASARARGAPDEPGE